MYANNNNNIIEVVLMLEKNVKILDYSLINWCILSKSN